MKFNIQYDSHKIAGWEEFYIEYKELKDYLKEAKLVLKERKSRKPSSYSGKEENPENISMPDPELPNLNHGVDLETQNGHLNFNKFKENFRLALTKADKFYKKIKEDLIYDFDLLKKLVDELIDKEVLVFNFRNYTIII
jgi:hypothetical protein